MEYEEAVPPNIPPRLELPPVIAEPSPYQNPPPPPLPPRPEPPKPKNIFQKMWAGLVAVVLATWKYVYLFFKLAKGAKILLTAGTMLLSIGFYTLIYGWKFAVGIVLCILVHELGHVFAAWRLKYPVSAPIFIPGFGALILLRNTAMSGWHNAIIGIGGPAFGALSAVFSYALYVATGQGLLLGVAYFAFFINLFNMIPVYPMDGGRIAGSVSPYLWVLGFAGLVALIFMGFVGNPFIWLLIILSLPKMVSSFKRGTLDSEGFQTTGVQKVIMGACYIGLCGFLLGGVIVTMTDANLIRNMPRRNRTPRTTPQPVALRHHQPGSLQLSG